MSEYQCYEFVALDQPLTRKAMTELRSISTRAEITPTRFWNEYDWGDLKADPAKLLARYFDAHLYFANWGTHRFMLRLPATKVDYGALRPYFPGGAASLTKTGRYVVLDLHSDSDDPEDDLSEGGRLGALAPLRASLIQGDLSVAYLAWLLAVQSNEVRAGAREPPVPAGLSTPSAPLSAFAEFLRIDPDLLRAAGEGSCLNDVDVASLRRWLQTVPTPDKDRWLLRAVHHPDEPPNAEILAAFRRQNGAAPSRGRTVADLLHRAEELRKTREQEETRRAAQARARDEAARRKRLDALDRQGDKAWRRLDRLVDLKEYDEAVRLTIDLRDLAQQARRGATFDARLEELRKRHPRRRGYLDEVKRRLAG
jgi:hypothetical protein